MSVCGHEKTPIYKAKPEVSTIFHESLARSMHLWLLRLHLIALLCACEESGKCRVVRYAVLFSTVGTTDPTILPARKVVLALAFDPLDNHEIAFGVYLGQMNSAKQNI